MRNTFVSLMVVGVSVFSTMTLADNNKRHSREKNIMDITISAYRPSIDTSVQLDSQILAAGTTISLEDDLSLADSKTLPALSLTFNLTDKTAIELGYFSLSRNGSKRINEQINFGDETFVANELIKTKFDVDIYRLGVKHDFFVSNKWNIAAGAGLHVTQFNIAIFASGNLSVGDKINETVPIPYLSISTRYSLSPKIHFGGQVDYFQLKVKDIEGKFVNAAMSVDYAFSQRLGAGLAYYFYDLEAEGDELTSDDLYGKIKYNYKGPVIFLRFGF